MGISTISSTFSLFATLLLTTQSRRTGSCRFGPPGGLGLLDRLAQAITDDPDGGEFLSVFEVNQYEPDELLRIGELEFRFFPTVHYVPCWAMRISNGVDGDLFYSADTGPAANLAAAARLPNRRR